jgi:hypothetical protein
MPVNDPPEVNVNAPFEDSESDPLPPPLTIVAVRPSPSASWSLASTPGAATDRVTPVTVAYESLTATGVALVTVMVTETVFVRSPESRYLKTSVPTKTAAGL